MERSLQYILCPKQFGVILKFAVEEAMSISVKIVCVIAGGVAAVALYSCTNRSLDVKEAGSINDKIIQMAELTENMTPSLRNKEIETISKTYNVSIELIEQQLAGEIMKRKLSIKELSGGYDIGTHIIDENKGDIIDPEKIKQVPMGGIFNFDSIAKNEIKELRPSGDLKDENSIYIEPLNIGQTDLANSTFVGYMTSGKYLQGSDYARTEALKQAESTPSGRSGWTGITRIFSGYADLGYVILEESDILAEQGVTLIPKGSLNVRVANYPATLIRLQDSSGKTMTSLGWINHHQHSYSLKIERIDSKSVGNLLKLAENIATSIKE